MNILMGLLLLVASMTFAERAVAVCGMNETQILTEPARAMHKAFEARVYGNIEQLVPGRIKVYPKKAEEVRVDMIRSAQCGELHFRGLLTYDQRALCLDESVTLEQVLERHAIELDDAFSRIIAHHVRNIESILDAGLPVAEVEKNLDQLSLTFDTLAVDVATCKSKLKLNGVLLESGMLFSHRSDVSPAIEGSLTECRVLRHVDPLEFKRVVLEVDKKLAVKILASYTGDTGDGPELPKGPTGGGSSGDLGGDGDGEPGKSKCPVNVTFCADTKGDVSVSIENCSGVSVQVNSQGDVSIGVKDNKTGVGVGVQL